MALHKLAPAFHERIWGSTRLGPWFPDSPEKIGEVWFQTGEVPLLVKFLFTTERLSVQVHPADEYARTHHKSPGKTEMWHVLAAEPGAKIAAGFREPVTKEQVREGALSGEIAGMLEWFEARPGDTFFIPAGTVHAIGGGLTLCEIQQLSDVTYRLYDYGRLDHGRPRELHLAHALAVAKLESHAAKCGLPVTGSYFTVDRLADSEYRALGKRPELLIAISGAGSIGGEPVRAGEVLCATPDSVCNISGDLQFLRAH